MKPWIAGVHPATASGRVAGSRNDSPDRSRDNKTKQQIPGRLTEFEPPALPPSPKPKQWGRNGASLRIVTKANEANEESGRLSFPASRSALAGSIRREPDANPMITR
jgi:hypothetical protein